MLYTEDFSMRHYVGFSQIGSHIAVTQSLAIVTIASRVAEIQYV